MDARSASATHRGFIERRAALVKALAMRRAKFLIRARPQYIVERCRKNARFIDARPG
jgi:hypothetical protein